MATDSLDRFGTKLEKRYTKQEIKKMLKVRVSNFNIFYKYPFTFRIKSYREIAIAIILIIIIPGMKYMMRSSK